MADYTPGQTVEEIERRHPFPWREQRMASSIGGLVRMLDATHKEVGLFEMTSLLRILTVRHMSPVTQAAADASPVTP